MSSSSSSSNTLRIEAVKPDIIKFSGKQEDYVK